MKAEPVPLLNIQRPGLIKSLDQCPGLAFCLAKFDALRGIANPPVN